MYEEAVWMTLCPLHLPWAALSTHLAFVPCPAQEIWVTLSLACFSSSEGAQTLIPFPSKAEVSRGPHGFPGKSGATQFSHHPVPANRHYQPAYHRQLQIKPSAKQTPVVSNSHAEIMPSSSLSYSCVPLSTPWTIPFCSTHQYTHAHFLLHAPVTSFPTPKRGIFFCKTVSTT